MKKVLYLLLSVFLITCLFVSCSSHPEEKKFFTVTFILEDETPPAPQRVERGGLVTKPDEEEFPFLWMCGEDEWVFESDTVKQDITLKGVINTSCIAAGTEITMKDGSLKSVEELKVGDIVRTFDHETGVVSNAAICFIMKSEKAYGAFTLHFENNIDITVVEEHGFYDNDLNKYVFINADNAKDYIGHHFYNCDQMCQIKLVSAEVLKDRVDAYAIVTSKHLNHMAEGMLSICDGSIKLFANLFEYDNNMKIDEAEKERDIKEYGLTDKEMFTKFNGFEEADYEDYNLMYTNIMIGKGLVTWEEIKAFYNLCDEYLNQQ